MKLMMQWVGCFSLVFLASAIAGAAAADDNSRPASVTSDRNGARDDAVKGADTGSDEDAGTSTAKSGQEVPARNTKVFGLEALLGYGGSEYTRLGLGLRAGMNIAGKEGLYVGAIGSYFLGSSITQDRLSFNAERRRKLLVLGAEAGWDVLATDDITVRPYMQLGIALPNEHTCTGGSCTDENGARLTVAPGAQAIYPLGSFHLGADFRYQIVFNKSDASAVVGSLLVGLRL